MDNIEKLNHRRMGKAGVEDKKKKKELDLYFRGRAVGRVR